MYKILVAVLLASTAVMPAIAAQPVENAANPQHRGGHRGREGAVARPSGEGERGAERLTKPRVAPGAGPVATPEAHRGVRIESVPNRREVALPPGGRRQVGPLPNRGTFDQRRPHVIQRAEPRMENRHVTTPITRMPNIERRQPPAGVHFPRMGTQPPPRLERRTTPRPQWNRNWRYNQTYDWQVWRRTHRSAFHVRPYRDPYGWAYQLFTIGWRLWPNYYSSGYWIDDPWTYRLPPAPPGTRWIRYYNDALLVDVWTGEVIDVVHDVFW